MQSHIKPEDLYTAMTRINEKYNLFQFFKAIRDDANTFLNDCYPLKPNVNKGCLELEKALSILKYKQEVLKAFFLCLKAEKENKNNKVKEYVEGELDKVIYIMDALKEINKKIISIKQVRIIIKEKSEKVAKKYPNQANLKDRRTVSGMNPFYIDSEKPFPEKSKKNWIRYDGRTN